MQDDEDDDHFKSLHQLVSCLSEDKPKQDPNGSELLRRDLSNTGSAFTTSTSSSSASSSNFLEALQPSSVLLENLVKDVSIIDLRIILAEYGEALTVRLLPGPARARTVSAQASFASAEEAEYAAERLNGIKADGRTLACRLVQDSTTADTSSSYSTADEEAKEADEISCTQEKDTQDSNDRCKVGTLISLEPGETGEGESMKLSESPESKVLACLVDKAPDPAESSEDITKGQQKIPVHDSEKLPRSLRRVAVDASRRSSRNNPSDRTSSHGNTPTASPSRLSEPSRSSSYTSPPASLPSRASSAYETMYSGGNSRPASVIGRPSSPQHLKRAPQAPRTYVPYSHYPQNQMIRQPHRSSLPTPTRLPSHPQSLASTTSPFPPFTATSESGTVDVNDLLKEAGIGDLHKLRTIVPDLRSLELLIVDLSKEYPRLLPTFGDRFHAKNVLRQYLHL